MSDLCTAQFERFSLDMTLDQAHDANHPGRCDDDAAQIASLPEIKAQLDALDTAKVRTELAEYGAWDAEELADDDANRLRVVWIAAGKIRDEELQEIAQ